METNLETLAGLKWDQPRKVNTGQGQKIVRSAKPTAEFWNVWRKDKAALKAVGISCSMFREEWQVTWWQDIPKEEKAARATASKLSRVEDMEIDVPAPLGLEYRPYQRGGVGYAQHVFNTGRGGVLFGDEMGLGKTIQVIGTINADPTIKNAIIVCPAFLKYNWERELNKWLTRPMSVGIAESKFWPKTDIVIVNYEVLDQFVKPEGVYYMGPGEPADYAQWVDDKRDVVLEEGGKVFSVKRANYECKDCKGKGCELCDNTGKSASNGWRIPHGNKLWDLMAFDEAHYIKNPKSKRSIATTSIRAKRRCAATGTPLPNKTIELWPILHYLQPLEFNNFIGWAKRYCGAQKLGHGWDFSGSTNRDELQALLRETCMVRRLKADVLKELPPKRRQVVEMPATEELARLTKQLDATVERQEAALEDLRVRLELSKVSDSQEEYRAVLRSVRQADAANFNELSQIAKALAIAKVPYIVEHIRDMLENTESKIIVFAHHHDVLDLYEKAFPDLCIKVDGRENDHKKRQAMVDEFQSDPRKRLFLGGMGATGVGITLTAADIVIFAEIDWVPGVMCQCEDRAHRFGQVNSVLVQLFVVAGSLDARKVETLVRKMEIISETLDQQKPREEVEAVSSRSYTSVTLTEITEEALGIQVEQIEAIHLGLRMLSGVCNGAMNWDGAGFSKIDTGIGKSLASRSFLTQKQAVLGMRMVNKYRGQLPEDLVAKATAGMAKKKRKKAAESEHCETA